jgi:hypothetical protein
LVLKPPPKDVKSSVTRFRLLYMLQGWRR